MSGRFRVDGNEIRARVGESVDPVLRTGNHQMAVDVTLRFFAEGFYDDGPEREVRNEMSVHDVDVKPFRSRFFD